jgi:uncharacterized membrane protein
LNGIVVVLPPCCGGVNPVSVSGSGPRFNAGAGPRFSGVFVSSPIPMLGIGYVVVVTAADAAPTAGLGYGYGYGYGYAVVSAVVGVVSLAAVVVVSKSSLGVCPSSALDDQGVLQRAPSESAVIADRRSSVLRSIAAPQSPERAYGKQHIDVSTKSPSVLG